MWSTHPPRTLWDWHYCSLALTTAGLDKRLFAGFNEGGEKVTQIMDPWIGKGPEEAHADTGVSEVLLVSSTPNSLHKAEMLGLVV